MSESNVALFYLSVLVAVLIVSAVRGPSRFASFTARLADHPSLLSGFYVSGVFSTWLLAAFVPVVVLASPALSSSDIGWAWPHGGYALDYILAATASLALLTGVLRTRSAIRRGRAVVRNKTLAIAPRTTAQRWLAALFGASAGITEELIYRGLLIAAGTHMLHLPLAVAVVASLAFFGAAHAYQGGVGILGSTLIGAMLTAIYMTSGSVILPIAVHALHNLAVMLLIPPPSAWPAPAEPSTPDPTPTPSPPEITLPLRPATEQP